MNYSVEFTTEALRDLEGIVDFITTRNSRQGAAFVEGLVEEVHGKIGAFPLSGPAIGKHRFTVFRGYVVAYSVDEAGKRVAVVLVTEGHRDWRTVLEERR